MESLLFFTALFVAPAAPVSAESLAWTRSAGGPGDEGLSAPFVRFSGDHLAVDPVGNVYVAGAYERGVRFDPGAAPHDSAGRRDLFVAKFDRGGALAWVRTAGGRGDDEAHAIAVDDRGQAYVTGHFSGRAVFGAGEARETRLETSDQQIFVAKYGSDGALQWAQQVQGPSRDAVNAGVGIGVDVAGAAYVTGTFAGSARFPSTRPDLVPPLVSVLPAAFVAKLDARGNVLWAQHAHGFGSARAESIAVSPAGDCAVIGRFQGLIDFGPEPQPITLRARDGEEPFVMKLRPDGRVEWLTQAPDGERGVRYSDVAFDPEGNTVLAGSRARPRNGASGLLEKRDGAGEPIWTVPLAALPAALTVASTGGVLVTGAFAGEARFGEGAGQVRLLGAGGLDAFYAGYRADGSLAWAYLLATGPGDQAGGGIAVDASDHRYVAGGFTGATRFVPGDARSVQLMAAGASDAFVARLTRFAP